MKRVKIRKEQYERLFTEDISESTDVTGGINRVNKSFKKEFAGSDIKNLEEDNFNITEPVSGISNSKMKPAKEVSAETPLREDLLSPEAQQAIYHFIENIWLNPSQKGLDRFFVENGITWGDIISYLTSVGIVSAVGAGVYRVNNFFKRAFGKTGDAEKEKKADIEKMAKLVAKDPESPWQKKVKMQQKPESGWEAKPKPFNPPPTRKVAEVVKEPVNNAFKPIAMNYEIVILNGPDGLYVLYYDAYDKEYFQDAEDLSIEDLGAFVNKNVDKLPKGVGMEGWNSNAELIKIDDELKNQLVALYSKNKDIVSALQNLQEMTSTASSGAFTTKLGDTSGLKNNITKDYTPATQLTNEVIEEMDTTTGGDGQVSSSTGQYTQPAIWANGKKNWKAAKKTQYPHGEMVDFDKCTKLNNNKSAQNGKCSTGAADSVVKTRRTKQSVISKTIYEQIAEKTGKTVEEVEKIIKTKLNKDNSLS